MSKIKKVSTKENLFDWLVYSCKDLEFKLNQINLIKENISIQGKRYKN